MRLKLTLFALLAGPVLGQNPYVVQMTPELKSRHRELITYLRDKAGFKADIEKVFLDLKNAMDTDAHPRDGNGDGQVSVDESKRQIMRLPSNQSEFGGKPAALQDAAKGKILGWEAKYPDDRAGDGVYDIGHAIRNKMQELGGKYSEELARIARHFDDYRKNALAHASDPDFLPQFDPNSPENKRYAKQVLKAKEAEFKEAIRKQAGEERKLAQKPPGPTDLLHYAWHLVTTDPAIAEK